MENYFRIFAGLVLERLMYFFEHEQPGNQFGLRRGLGIDDAMVVLENICGKLLAWEFDFFFASLGSQKTSDRIEHDSLLETLPTQGVPNTCPQVLRQLFVGEFGLVRGSNVVSTR